MAGVYGMDEEIKILEKQFRKKSTDIWNTWYRCLFFLAFFLALLMANTVWESEASWVGFLSESSLLSCRGTAEMGSGVILSLLRQRVISWCMLVLFSRTLPGMWYGGVLVGWQGFSLGFFFVSVLTRYGIRGISVFFCICFPQWILYLTATFCMLKLMNSYREWCMIYGNEKRRRYTGLCSLFSAVYIAGMLCEYYVNPYFLSVAKSVIDVGT